MTEYYRAYEERYRAVRQVSQEIWGHSEKDGTLKAALEKWVSRNSLKGRRVLEFACGEGAAAVMLADMGCLYRGVDIAPTALETAKKTAAGRANVEFGLLDMVEESAGTQEYDAVLDISGLHMLVTDAHRMAYLKNAFEALRPGGCALFWQESYRTDAYEGEVESIAQWAEMTGLDFDTPEERNIGDTGKTVMLKLLPARPRTAEGYRREMEYAGFVVDGITELASGGFIATSAAIQVHRPL